MSPSSIALEAVVAVLLLVEGRSGRTDGLPEDRTLYCQAVRTDTAAKRRTQAQLTEESQSDCQKEQHYSWGDKAFSNSF